MTFLLDMINGIHKFLGYLDISPKYLNRALWSLSQSKLFTDGFIRDRILRVALFLGSKYFLLLF